MKFHFAKARFAAVCALAAVAAGCAKGGAPENSSDQLYMPEKTGSIAIAATDTSSVDSVGSTCAAPGNPRFIFGPKGGLTKNRIRPGSLMLYSKGDRLNIRIMDGDEFSGDYAINADGLLYVPFIRPIPAAGLTNQDVANRLRSLLIAGGIFKSETLKLSVRPVQYAPIQISITGAVFRPGLGVINKIADSDKQVGALAKTGDSPTERFVAAALRSAGGVRPDADVSNVTLVRNGKKYRLDWRGAFTGGGVDDVPLIAGDTIYLPESPCFQSGLVRPSQITPETIRVFVSNLTSPANSNGSAGVSSLSQNLPYGSRLLQGLVFANCVGGATSSNADRSAVLISTNPKTGQTEVVERSIEELVRSSDRDTINPYLMPDDAIACYDSAVTNFREVTQTLSMGINTALAGKAIGR